MITEDYVSFETAKLLKEKGFDGLCTAYYDCFTTDNFHCGNEPTDFNSIDTKIRNIVAAPTLQMTMKWLREVQNIDIAIYAENTFHGKRYSASIWKDITRNSMKNDAVIVAGAITYEEACEAAIKYCLENLILDPSENDARQN